MIRFFQRTLLLIILSFVGACSRQMLSEDIYLSLSEESLSFTDISSTGFIVVNTNTSWHLQEDFPEWLHVLCDNGSLISFAVDENIQKSNRYASVVLLYGNDSRRVISISQSGKTSLSITGNHIIQLSEVEQSFMLNVSCNVPYTLNTDVDWIEIPSRTSFQMFFDEAIEIVISENQGQQRFGKLVVANENHNVSDTLTLIQSKCIPEPIKPDLDGSHKSLQVGTQGHVKLIVMGDGFTREMIDGREYYDSCMNAAVNCFFSIEPYKTFRDYFDVHQVNVVSEQAGVGDNKHVVNNRLGSRYGEGTEIRVNTEACINYVRGIDAFMPNNQVTVIVVLNDYKYAGTTYMYTDGNSIALCPMSKEASPNDFEGLVHHEACGHGFGFLADEYVYYSEQLPDKEKQNLNSWQSLGFNMNLDISPTPYLWKDLIECGKYNYVGMYEGGGLYQYGVWRCERNSCMNNNIPYFNTQSRRTIIQRIRLLSGEKNYTISDFLSDDATLDLNWNENIYGGLKSYARNTSVEPLASPIRVNNSFF